MYENRCVCCGEIIPEGNQVCEKCIAKINAQEFHFDEPFEEKTDKLTWRLVLSLIILVVVIVLCRYFQIIK